MRKIESTEGSVKQMNKNESKISDLLKKNEMSDSETVHLLLLIRKELESL